MQAQEQQQQQEELKLDGKLEDRFAVDKLFLSGTADPKWISESLRLAPASNVAALIAQVQEVGLAARMSSKSLDMLQRTL